MAMQARSQIFWKSPRRVISAFARGVVFGLYGVDVCVASPDARNQRSLRAFEKAGFKALRTFTVPKTGNQETLMVLRRV